jgi:hypothetical protein
MSIAQRIELKELDLKKLKQQEKVIHTLSKLAIIAGAFLVAIGIVIVVIVHGR